MVEVRFREASVEDCRLIFEWANDPVTRANSATPGPIPWETHVDWFEQKRADPNAEIWIAVDAEDGTPAGLVRFDVDGDSAEIGVSVVPGRRGGGIGSRIIDQASQSFFRRRPGIGIVAHVRHGNGASKRAFLKAGYEPDGEATVRGVTMLRFVRVPGPT